MTEESPRRFKHRFPVDVTTDSADLERRLDSLLLHLPSGSAHRRAPFGFSFRREPDVFAAISTGTSLGMGILLAEFSTHVRYYSVVGVTLSALSFLVALIQITRFARNAFGSVEVTAAGSELVQSTLFGGRVRRAVRVHADQIVTVLVVQEEGETARVLLGGPRHAIVGEVFRTKVLDPERLAPWLAEMVALVARRASIPE